MKSKALLAVVCLLAVGSAASAQSYVIKKIGDGYRQAVTINGIRSGNYYAGQFLMQFSGVVPEGYEQNFTAYCVDLIDTLQTTETVTLESTDDLNPKSLTPSTGAKVAYLYNTYGSTVADNAHAAALQIAIWETLYDGGSSSGLVKGSSASGGTVYFDGTNSTVLTYAAAYLQGLGSNTSEATWLACTSHPSQTNQDLITRAPTRITSVPEPGPLAMLAGLGVGFTVFGSRFRRRK